MNTAKCLPDAQHGGVSIRYGWGVLCLLLVCCCLGCGESAPSSSGGMTLSVALNPWPGNYPMIVAREKGFFAKRGLSVDCVLIDDSLDEMSKFSAGIYDGAALALGSFLVIAGRTSDFGLVLVVDRSDGADAVVARKGIETVEQLKGKRIGTMLGGFGELFTLTMLGKHGLGPEDVTLVNTDASQVPELLAKGAIDAGQAWEPFVGQAVRAGGQVVFSSRETGLVIDALGFQRRTIRQKPEAVRAFVDGWFEAIDYCLAEPAAATQLLAKVLKKPEADCAFEGMKLYSREDNKRAFADEADPEGLYGVAHQYAEFFARKGNSNLVVNVRPLIEPGFL